jgi:hypothetical protein
MDATLQKLKARSAAASARVAAVAPFAESATRPPPEPRPPTPVLRVIPRQVPAVAEAVQKELFERERAGHFRTTTLVPGHEYPTFFTRLPIFVPAKRASLGKGELALLDEDRALPFETSWGRGRRFGAPLTVYDEDTLIALFRLRQLRITGHAERLPVALEGGQEASVHALVTTVSEIQRMCGSAPGGKSNSLRKASIRRLSGTRIELERGARGEESGAAFTLLDVTWRTVNGETVAYVQFPPVMAGALERAYSYVNLEIRQQLSDTGKAVHRFLSSQGGRGKDYRIGTKILMKTLGYPRSHKAFLRDLRDTMRRLESLGWCDWSLMGSRSAPHTLYVRRR